MRLSAIKQMEGYARKHPDVISLSQGIPASYSDLTIRLAVIQALLSNKVDKYSDPQGIYELRRTVSTSLKEDGMNYSPLEILVTAGAVEAMTVSLLALLKPGDEIIIPTPTYSAFFRSAELAKLSVVPLPLNEEEGWSLDIELLEANITPKTRAILICNPNNPTGSVITKVQFEAICQLAIKHHLLIFLDEVYHNMYYCEDELYNPCTKPLYKEYLVRIVSFSKDFSLTGWRVGFLHSSKKLITKILPIHDTVINCAPVISQYAALNALYEADRLLAHKKEIYRTNRQLVGERLEALSAYLSFNWPKGSYFFFPKIKEVTNSQWFCWDLLQKADLALVPGSDFGVGGEGHVRICFGRERQAIINGMERLERYLKENL